MDYRLMLIRRTGWQWPLGSGDRLVLWDTKAIRVSVEIPALVNLLLAKALEADFVKLLLVERKKRHGFPTEKERLGSLPKRTP